MVIISVAACFKKSTIFTCGNGIFVGKTLLLGGGLHVGGNFKFILILKIINYNAQNLLTLNQQKSSS